VDVWDVGDCSAPRDAIHLTCNIDPLIIHRLTLLQLVGRGHQDFPSERVFQEVLQEGNVPDTAAPARNFETSFNANVMSKQG
jgi:hypothetical protein